MINSLLYILQINNYDLRKFIKFSYSHFNWRNLQQRGKLVFTKKILLIYFLTVIITIFAVVYLLIKFGLSGILLIILFYFLYPLIISLILIIIYPLDYFLKKSLILKAKAIMAENKKIIVIGITGSYGKTSAKEILSSILSEKYKILKTPENINTDLGITEFIIRNKNKFNEYDLFIVEMGAYKIGEIKKICNLVQPNYSILTGINEAHLERFGSIANTIKAKFELPEATELISILNFDDLNIKNNYSRFKINKPVGVASDEVKNVNILENFSGLEFEINNEKYKTKLLAEHNISLILLAITLAKKLGLSTAAIISGISKINIIKHRLEPIYNKNSNIWVIDDSYNGNFNGIVSGLSVLQRAQGKKLVLTPGLVELGAKSEEVHEKIGELYAAKADYVLLINTKATNWIKAGLEKNNFHNYKIYNSTEEAHNDLKNILKPGDTIIFQNDLPDNYF